MKKIIFLVALSFINMISIASGHNVVTWKSPYVIYNNTECVKVEKIAFNKGNTEVTICCKSSRILDNVKNSYLSDNLHNTYKFMSMDTLFVSKGESHRFTVIYEKCSPDVSALDIVNLFSKHHLRIDGIMKKKKSFCGLGQCHSSSTERSVFSSNNSIIVGHIENWDPCHGNGFVYAINDYATKEPNTYYTRIDGGGNFKLMINSNVVKVLYLCIPFMENTHRVPIIAVPDDTLEISVCQVSKEDYFIKYNTDKCKSKLVSTSFLKNFPVYPTNTPFSIKKAVIEDSYEKKIQKYHDEELMAADYYKWKYSISDREFYMYKRSSDINYLTNYLYLIDLKDTLKLSSPEKLKDQCLAIVNDQLCVGLPGYNRLKSMTEERWTNGMDSSKKQNESIRIQVTQDNSVFKKMPNVKNALQNVSFYQFVFIDSTEQCINVLKNMDNLIYDFAKSEQLRFVFVKCDSLYRCNNINLIINHFLEDQTILDLSLDDYFLLNECLGNIYNDNISRTVNSEGIVLKNSLPISDETKFRRNLRRNM